MVLAVVVGVAFMASFFLFFALQLDIKEHGVLRNLLIIFAFSSLLLIPNAIINQEACEPVINQSISTSLENTTTSVNEYSTYCYNPLQGAKGFLKAANLAYLVFLAYIIVYLGYKSFIWLAESVSRRGGR